MDRTPARNRQCCGGAGHDDGDECRRAGRDELAREIAAIPDAVRDNPTLSRFELDANGVTAVAKYKITGSVITFTHTEVPPQARGGSIASRLIAGALQAARARVLKIAARCSFVSACLARHLEFHLEFQDQAA